MNYGVRIPNLAKSIAAKLSTNRMLKQQLGFGKGLIPDRKKAKYNKRYSKMLKRMEDMKDMEDNKLTAQSERIKAIQQKLKKMGVYKRAVTGILDSNTINAIKEFQKRAGIEVTGILDFRTLIELDKKSSKKQQKDK